MNIITTIIIIGIVYGILEGFALMFFVHRGNRLANRILGFLVIIMAFCIAGMLFMRIDAYSSYPHLILVTQPLLFLFGPLFWLYVQLMTHRMERFHPRFLLHAIPFILCILYRAPFYLKSAAEKIALLEQWNTQTTRSDLIITGIQLLHIIIYLILVLRQVRIHQVAIKKEYSSIKRINLEWVRIFVFSISVISVIMAIFIINVQLK